MRKFSVIFFTASISTIVLIFFVFFKENDGKLHLIICDVGQGDAIFIKTPSQADILIDGGPDKRVLDCLSKNMPFWDRSLDIVISTHPDADHLAGIVDVIDRYRLRYLFDQSRPGNTELFQLFTNELAVKKLSARHLNASDKLKIKDGVLLTVLWPRSPFEKNSVQTISNQPLNQSAVVILLEYRKFKALLTADAGSSVMDQIAKEAADIDVLKVPHHGSRTGMSNLFLSTTRPELAIISVGENNRYGHPAKISLDLLKNHKVKTLRTDKDGDIDIISDGLKYSVKISHDDSRLPSD